jgi:hypothetical protein
LKYPAQIKANKWLISENQFVMKRIEISRRNFIRITGLTAAGTGLTGCGIFSNKEELRIYESKATDCFMGAAIADAMGGPVEYQHYKRIAEYFPDFRFRRAVNFMNQVSVCTL